MSATLCQWRSAFLLYSTFQCSIKICIFLDAIFMNWVSCCAKEEVHFALFYIPMLHLRSVSLWTLFNELSATLCQRRNVFALLHFNAPFKSVFIGAPLSRFITLLGYSLRGVTLWRKVLWKGAVKKCLVSFIPDYLHCQEFVISWEQLRVLVLEVKSNITCLHQLGA